MTGRCVLIGAPKLSQSSGVHVVGWRQPVGLCVSVCVHVCVHAFVCVPVHVFLIASVCVNMVSEAGEVSLMSCVALARAMSQHAARMPCGPNTPYYVPPHPSAYLYQVSDTTWSVYILPGCHLYYFTYNIGTCAACV